MPGSHITELCRRLCSGDIQAASRRSLWKDSSGRLQAERFYEVHAAHLWKTGGNAAHDSQFWAVGTRQFNPKDRFGNAEPVECFGLRFDPVGIDLMLTDAGVAPRVKSPLAERVARGFTPSPSQPVHKTPRKQDLPVLPNQIAEAWADWFKGNAPRVTREAAEASAAHMFPNHNFNRDRIRDLIEPAKQGQRPKTK